MRRLLPKLNVILFLFVVSCFGFLFHTTVAHHALAQGVTPTPTTVPTLTPTPTIPSALQQNEAAPGELPGDWIIDPEVTTIGKNAARAGIFLDWALTNYNWVSLDLRTNEQNPLIPFWITIRNIVYAFLILVIITGALVLIVTRGRSVTLRKFIPRFLLIAVLVTFSFAFVEFLYQVVDVFQGFFIRPGNVAISQKDLLFIGWSYKDFVGLRALGSENFESAFISLLLVKLTSFTYYAMVGILLVRKIILWFFIMISPFFPLLLLFYPLRNTAKIWIGEFFRWLLYAPLFAIFLAGLVSLWRIGIPLSFNFDNAKSGLVIFPTAVSILLGGPLQKVGVANSVNLADTFGLYLVALIMLWMVIIFPFILLQIFLDFFSNLNVNQNALSRQLVNFMTRPPAPSGGTPPPSPISTGLARALPFIRDFAIPKPVSTGVAREIPRMTQTQQQQQNVVVRPLSVSQKESVEKLTNISIPTIRDIARLEATRITKDTTSQKEKDKLRETLQSIANPTVKQSSVDRERYSEVKEKLTAESKIGNQLASTVLHAAQTIANESQSSVQNISSITNFITHLANPASLQSAREREKYVTLREQLVSQKEKNTTLASSVISAMQAMTSSSKQTLQTIVQTLAHPEEASKTVKQSVTDLKEILLKESESGNSLAKTMLSVFEKLETIERVSSILLNIKNPSIVKEIKEKERFEKIKETLVKESEKNNTLATTLLSQLTSLASASSTDEKREIVTSIRDAVTKEQEKNNTLAEYIAHALPDLMQVSGGTTLAKMQDDLEKAMTDGNPLAAKLLAIASETSTERQKEKLAALQSEIADAKAKGDPLATTLSDMLYPKPKLATKPDAFPTVNRIQEVSLDDYEAVKKMWVENYQNLDTTGNLGDTSKKEWIADDIKQITDTIDLLTSQNTEKIEEGMQKVSDILPFLLVGGFSESEIVAYLKAKQSAGKDVLEAIEKQGNDEETKLDVEHHVTAPLKSATVSESLTASSESIMPEMPLMHEIVEQKSNPILQASPKLITIPGTSSTQMLRLANISIPTIRSVASFDEAMVSHNVGRTQEVEKMQKTLLSIANPGAIKDSTERLRYTEILDALEKESEQGNAVASSLVSAGRLMGRLTAQAAFAGVLQLRSVVEALAGVTSTKDSGEKESAEKLLQTIRFQAQNGDATASTVLAVLQDKAKQMPVALLSLHSALLTASQSGNQLATTIVSKMSQIKRESFTEQLQEMTGMYLLIDALQSNKSLFTDASSKIDEVVAEVKKQAASGNDLAKSILSLKDKNDYHGVLMLVETVDHAADHFAKSLRTSLRAMSVASPLIQSQQPSSKLRLTKVLSLLTRPLGTSPQVVQLHEQLIEAKKSGSVLAEQVLLKADEETKEEIKVLSEILSAIDAPASLADQGEKASFSDMRTRLEKEKAKNNELADEILTVAHAIGAKTTSSLDKSTIAVMLWEELVLAKREGDQIAASLLEAADKLTLRDRVHALLADALSSLRQPEAITDAAKRERYLMLQKTISSEATRGNVLAQTVQALLQKTQTLDPTVLQKFIASLEEESGKGNTLAHDFLTLLQKEEQGESLFAILRMMRGVSDPEAMIDTSETDEYKKLRASLQKAAGADNVVAMSLLAASERAKAEGDDLSEAKKLQELLGHDQSDLSQTIHAFIDNEVEKYEDMLMLRSILHGMQHPDYVPDVTSRTLYEVLQKDLTIEAQHGNTVSKMIEKTLTDIEKQGIAVDQEMQTITQLYNELKKAKREGNARANEMMQLIQTQHLRVQASRLALVMEYIADPQSAPVGRDQEAYTSMKQTLVLERNKGNTFADFLLKLAQNFSAKSIKEEDMPAILALLYQKLTISEKEGNSFAMSLLARLQPAAKEKRLSEIEASLLKAEKTGDPVAKSVFAVIDAEHEKNRAIDSVVLPSVNRIQEVSLDDYEAVRSMWEESYKTLDVPQKISGERPSRTEWLRGDITRIESSLGLLTSVDQEKINEGMQDVAGILPFLLIGGFSLSEIIAYLKAKLQAAKTVLGEQDVKEEEGRSVKKDVSSTEKTQEAEA